VNNLKKRIEKLSSATGQQESSIVSVLKKDGKFIIFFKSTAGSMIEIIFKILKKNLFILIDDDKKRNKKIREKKKRKYRKVLKEILFLSIEFRC
jgi:hypothetical protein